MYIGILSKDIRIPPNSARVIAFVMPLPGCESWNYGLKYSHKFILMRPEVQDLFELEQKQHDDALRRNVLAHVFTDITIVIHWQELLINSGLESFLEILEQQYHIHTISDFQLLTDRDWKTMENRLLLNEEQEWKLQLFKDQIYTEQG